MTKKQYESVLAMMHDALGDDPDFVIELAEQVIRRQSETIERLSKKVDLYENPLPLPPSPGGRADFPPP